MSRKRKQVREEPLAAPVVELPSQAPEWVTSEWIGFLAVLLPLAMYFYTGAPSVTLVDSGEFVTALRTLGIPHPPGVPTYVLLGHLFTLLPLSADIARRTTLFSSVCAALTAGVSYRITRDLLPDVDNRLALAGALAFGFSMALWAWAVLTEVYALNILLLSVVFLLAGRGRWAWTSFVAGLALGVHHATILFALPAATYLLWVRRRPGWREIASGTAAGLLGLCIYAYLPLRSAQGPLLDWGHPVGWERFWWVVSGRQYQNAVLGGAAAAVAGGAPASSLASSASNLVESISYRSGKFLEMWIGQTTPLGFLLICAGLVMLFRRQRIAFWFTALLIAFNVGLVWLSGLGGLDIAGYYLPAFLTVSWCFALGADVLVKWLKGWNRTVTLSMIFIVAVVPAVVNFSANNRHDDRVGRLFVENSLRGVEPNSLIFTSDWQFYSPWLCRRFVENDRPDVIVISASMLPSTWYLDNLRQMFPAAMQSAEKERAAFREYVDRMEHRLPLDPDKMSGAYDNFVAKLIRDRRAAGGEVYCTYRTDAQAYVANEPKSPHGLLYHYAEGSSDVELDLTGLLGGVPEDEPLHRVKQTYSQMITARAIYLTKTGNSFAARDKLAVALQLDPENDLARRMLGDAQ